MTREKQIDEFANSQVDCEFFDESLHKGIIIGAKWADEHPKEEMVSLEKVCSWINNVDIDKYLRCLYSGIVSISFIRDNFIKDLKSNVRGIK